MTASIADSSTYVTGIGGVSTPTISWSHTVTSVSDRILLVFPSGESAIAPAVQWSGVTFGGVALTQLVHSSADETANAAIDCWYLLNPSVGTGTIVCTGASGSVMSHGAAAAYTVKDAAQLAPQASAHNETTTDGTTLTLTAASLTANALIIAAICTNVEDAAASNVGASLSALVGSPGEGGSRFASYYLVKASAGPQSFIFTSAGTYGRAAGVIVAIGGVSDTLGVTDIANKRVFQRSSLTVGSVPVAGVAISPITAVEARVMQGATEVKTWASLTVSGGTYTGSLTSVPAGGGYHLEVRGKNSGGTVVASIVAGNVWGIGCVVLVAGSSTAEKWFTDATGEAADALVSKFSGAWSAVTGSAAISFSNALLDFQPGIPIGLIDTGVSGSYLTDWADEDGNYTASVADVTTAGGVIEAIICHAGSNDARYATVVQATHLSDYETLIANWRSDVTKAGFVSTLPVLITTCQRCPTGEGGENWTRARTAELLLCEETAIYLGAMAEDLPIDSDQTHMTPAAMAILGRRVAYSYSVAVLGQSRAYRGPEPASVTYTGTALTVTFDLNGGSQLYGKVAQTGITGFRVSTDNFATLQPVSAAAISGTNKVVLTVPSGLTGLKVDYLCGPDPNVSNCLGNNAAAPV